MAQLGHDETHHDWPVRAAMLALLGAGIAVAVHLLLQGAKPVQTTEDSGRLAFAAFLVVSGTAFGFVVERGEHRTSVGFAAIAGLVVAGGVHWGSIASGGDGEQWRLICSMLTVTIAAPLFLSWRVARGDAGGIPYIAAHDRAWTAVVLGLSAAVFVVIAIGLAHLLGALFALIGLGLLNEFLDKPWFSKLLGGLAFGGAIGLLRDRERVLGTLRRVATTVLAVLAPVLAIGLIVFLCALPLTGLAPLWEATKSTTPILLSCIIGALILANAVIGNADEDESRRRPLRWAAMGLGAAVLPLGVIAAVSTGLRISQYGLTPDRLWAVVFTGIACAYGMAYLVALVRSCSGWTAPVRAANLRLALALCGLAFVLSTPLLSFGAISTRDQLTRLNSGRTPVDKFDWTALRFDFGATGKAALVKLEQSGTTPAIRAAAALALKSDSRWAADMAVQAQRAATTLDARLRILPASVPLPAGLRLRLAETEACQKAACVLFYTQNAKEAVLVGDGGNGISRELIQLGPTGWRQQDLAGMSSAIKPTPEKARQQQITDAAQKRASTAALARGDVEVRTTVVAVSRRQVFVGGKPVGTAFDRDLAPEKAN